MEMYAAHHPPGYDFPISTLFFDVLGVQTTAGKWITHPPTRCPNARTPLEPNQVLVGHQACLGLYVISHVGWGGPRPRSRAGGGMACGSAILDNPRYVIRDVEARCQVLLDRRTECQVLAGLTAAVRAGESRALVLRGEPGVGKTALLEYLVGQAPDCRVARAAGVQSEMELAFAGLHQLCAPLLDRLDHLPGPQRDALRTAFGLSREADQIASGRAGRAEPAGRDRARAAADLRCRRHTMAGPRLGAGAGIRRAAIAGGIRRDGLRGAGVARRRRSWPV